MEFDPGALTRQPSASRAASATPKVLAEWSGTLHATAWQDPVFVSSAGRPMKMECKACHSPSRSSSGISPSTSGRGPLFRDFNHADSVNCVACHLRHDGTVAARQDRPDAPCRPVRDPRLSSAALCGSCHNPTHDAQREWERSQARALGVSCNDCHSQVVYRTGADGRKKAGFSHVFPGGNDLEFVRKAIRTECSLNGRRAHGSRREPHGAPFSGRGPDAHLPHPHPVLGLRRHARPRGDAALPAPRQGRGRLEGQPLRARRGEVARPHRAGGTTRVKVDFLFQNGPFALFDKAMTIARWEAELR
jgi:hypothetical protein